MLSKGRGNNRLACGLVRRRNLDFVVETPLTHSGCIQPFQEVSRANQDNTGTTQLYDLGQNCVGSTIYFLICSVLITASCGNQRINLIDEEYAGCLTACTGKYLHYLLSGLVNPLAGNIAIADRQDRQLQLTGQRLGKHGLAVPWLTKQQDVIAGTGFTPLDFLTRLQQFGLELVHAHNGGEIFMRLFCRVMASCCPIGIIVGIVLMV